MLARDTSIVQLVIDGMKLQPCSPGFVDGRNAILQADQLLTNGANQCEIWRGFAKRGLGASASQGSSNDRTDGVSAFDLPADFGPVELVHREQPQLLIRMVELHLTVADFQRLLQVHPAIREHIAMLAEARMEQRKTAEGVAPPAV